MGGDVLKLTTHTIMMTKLMLVALFVAVAAASNVDDTVPETDFAEVADASSQTVSLYRRRYHFRHNKALSKIRNMRGMTTKKMNQQIAKKKANEAQADKRGKKEDATQAKMTSSTNWPLCSSLHRDAREWKIYDGKKHAFPVDCRCKGAKVADYLKKPEKKDRKYQGKTTLKKGENWNTKYNGGAEYHGGPHAKACWIEYGKKSKMANPDTKPCPDNGRATSATCSSPPPPPPKKSYCKCTVQGHKKSTRKKVMLASEGGSSKTYNWEGQKFRKITCTGCEYVRIYDDDDGTCKKGCLKEAQDIILGKNSAARAVVSGQLKKLGKDHEADNKSCCGKNTCSFDPGSLGDLQDDVQKIVMQGAC